VEKGTEFGSSSQQEGAAHLIEGGEKAEEPLRVLTVPKTGSSLQLTQPLINSPFVNIVESKEDQKLGEVACKLITSCQDLEIKEEARRFTSQSSEESFDFGEKRVPEKSLSQAR
jgi:hypothetical protein